MSLFYIDSTDLEKNKKIILDSNLFDKNYYLKRHKDVKDSKIDPLHHWVRCGYKEPRNPNSRFNNLFYRHFYLNSEERDWNSLTHFISIGSKNGFKSDIYENSMLEYEFPHIVKVSNVLRDEISIFLIVFDYSEELKLCIDNIINNTKLNFELILLTFNKFPQDFFSFTEKYDAKIIIKENNNDNFLEFVNETVSCTKNNFVIMNNYTLVSPNWLTKLILKAYSDDNIGISFPLSNTNSSIYPHHKNLDGTLEFAKDGLNDLFNKFSLNLNFTDDYSEAFCFFVKYQALKEFEIKLENIIFNANEKKFLVCNMLKNNMKCVLDDTTYIYNKIELFSSDNKFLKYIANKEDPKNIKELLPKKISENINLVLDNCDRKKLFNRVLFIFEEHEFKLCHDFLFNPILKNYDCYFLTNDKNNITLWKNSKKINVWKINNEELVTNDIIYKSIYFNIINSFKIELVHLNGLKFNSLDICDVCKLMKIPLIFYSDDIHFIHQINEINRFQDYNQFNLIKNYIEKLYKLFDYADIFLSNDTVKKEFLQLLPNFSDNIEILNNSFIYGLENRLLKMNESDVFKILIPHNMDGKLENLLLNIKEDERFSDIEFHILDNSLPKLKGKYIFHGPVSSDNLKKIVNEIDPEFLFITHIFKDIFNILDISNNEKIPIFVKYSKLLINAIDQQKGTKLVNTNSPNELFKSMKSIFNIDDYCKTLRNMINSDKYFKSNLNLFNQTLTETYTKYQKDYKLTSRNSSISQQDVERDPDFSNFEGFLAHSYTSPFIKAPFLEEEKRCFALMDNITKYLINNVRTATVKPLVSIIMPVFNRENVVFDAINSVLNQTYENWELIIVDDCSTDGTRDLLKTLNNDKIKVLFHETNSGSSSARNTALKESKGEIITYLDSDNEWDSKYIEAMVGAFIELPDADALYSAQLIYNNSEIPVAMRFASFNKSLLHNTNYIDMNSFCHKRHVLNKIGYFDEKLIRLIDWDFILRISNNFKVYSVPVLLSKYYVTRADNRITDSTHAHISLFNSNVGYMMKVREKNKFKPIFDKPLSKKVSIIIPSFESLSDLRECINSILNLDYGDSVKIIVVDNNSNDSVRFYLKNLNDDGIIDLIQNDINYGFTYAVNQGISISDPDSDILLMNNDSILTENALNAMQDVAYNFDDCGLVVPQQVLPDGSSSIRTHVPYAKNIFECDVNPSIHHNNITNVPTFHDGEVLELNFAPFFCVYIKREILLNSFGLDAELGRHYRSDRIFSDYVKDVMGLKIYHTSNAVVYHKLLKSTTKLKENKDKYDLIYLKNQWEDDLSKKLGFSKALWDY